MQKIANTRETLGQIGAACVELARGCERAQLAELAVDDLDVLVVALREVLGCAEKLRENAMSSAIDAASDHDGDTQPANEPPAPPVCKCGHLEREHMPPLPLPGADVLRTARNICIFCECERFEV